MKMLKALKVTASLIALLPALAQANSSNWYFEIENANFFMYACCPDGNTCTSNFLSSGTFLYCSQSGNARVHRSDNTFSFQVYPSSCPNNITRITIRYDQDVGNYTYSTGCY